MRRILRVLALVILMVGPALWFFGGMNTGPSQWTEDAATAEHAPGTGAGRRAVFRPGLSFLAASVAASLGLMAIASKAGGRGNDGA